MKNLFLLSLFLATTACIADPVDLENTADCTPSSFVGTWEYQSTNGMVLDSIPDIEIILSDDDARGSILLDSIYYDINSAFGCTVGDVNGLIDMSYELKSNNELHRKTTALVLFGSTDIYKKK